MFIVFIEYKIQPTHWSDYIQKLDQLREETREMTNLLSHKIITSTMQEGQVVEIIEVEDEISANYLKKERLKKDRLLYQLDPYVEGGISRIKCWIFRDII